MNANYKETTTIMLGQGKSKRRVGAWLTSSSNIIKPMIVEGDKKKEKCQMVGGSCLHCLLILDQFY